MFNIVVSFGPGPTAWGFLYKKEEDARQVINLIKNNGNNVLHEIVDDYGSHACIQGSAIHGVMMEDLSKTGEAQIERGLNQARVQARAEQRVSADVLLSGKITRPSGMAGMNGPRIVS